MEFSVWTGAGVAAGKLDHRLPWRERPIGFCLLDDLASNPILLGEARIQIVELSEDPALEAFGYAGQHNYRRCQRSEERRVGKECRL